MTVEDPVVEAAEWTYCDVTRKPVLKADTVEFQRLRVSAEGKNILLDWLKFGDHWAAGPARPSFIRRLLGTLVDGFVVGGASAMLMTAFVVPFAVSSAARGGRLSPEGVELAVMLGSLAAAAPAFFYYALMHWKYGQTLGKMAAKYKVVNADGTPITLRTALLRSFWSNGAAILGQIVPAAFGSTLPLVAMVLALGFSVYGISNSVALIVDTKYGRALHDRFAGTRVVMIPGCDRRYGGYPPPAPAWTATHQANSAPRPWSPR